MNQQAVARWLFGAAGVFAVIVLVSCPNPLTRTMVINVKDETAPVITISSPAEGSYCANIVEIVGQVTDTATSAGADGQVRSLMYTVPASTVSGTVDLAADGGFALQFSTVSLGTNFVVFLAAVDWNGNSGTASLALQKQAGNGIPSFQAEADNHTVTLSWEPVPRTASYTLLYTTNGSLPCDGVGERIDNAVSPCRVEELANGNLHVFRLQTVPQDNWPESLSDYLQAIPLSRQTLAPTVIADYGKLSVEWDRIAGEDTFVVYKSTGRSSDAVVVSEVTGNRFDDADVEPGVDYFYRIRPSLAGSLLSAANCAQTLLLPPNGVAGIGSLDFPGYGKAVQTSGDYAYVAASDSGLLIVDISEPSHPVLVAAVDTPGSAAGVAINGVYAYIADGSGGLQIVGISDPRNPQALGAVDTSGNALGVDVSGAYAFVADGLAGLQVVDVSAPSSPSLVKTLGTGAFAYGVHVSGAYAYVANSYSGVYVASLSNPANPTYAGSYNTPGSCLDVTLAGAYAYVADDTGGLRILDVSSPASPQSKGVFAAAAASGVVVSGSRAFVADGGSGVRIVDVSDPASPVLASFIDTPGSAFGLSVVSDTVYVADGQSGLQVLRVLDPSNAQIVGSATTSSDNWAVATCGDYAYVAGGSAGMHVVSISDAANPTVLTSVVTGGQAETIAVNGDYVYVGEDDGWLRILDITSPASPEIAGSFQTFGSVRSIAVRGDRAFLGVPFMGLMIVDVSEPGAVELIGLHPGPVYAPGTALRGEWVYVADGSLGLKIFDVSNLLAPFLVGELDVPGDNECVALAGDFALVGSAETYLHIVDVSQPAVPSLACTCEGVVGYPEEVTVSGGYAFIAQEGGLVMISISNPTAPTVVTSALAENRPHGLALRGRYVYLAERNSAFRVVDLLP